jgi:hypothetical protein
MTLLEIDPVTDTRRMPMPVHLFVPLARAAEIAGISRGHTWRLCSSGAWSSDSFRIGKSWYVNRIFPDTYVRAKPGLKLGQKINRNKK